MKKTAVLLYPQFSEYELSVALSILMQGNKPTVTVGLTKQPIHGESGLTCIADVTISELDLNEIDSILLPGCMDFKEIIHEQKFIHFLQQAVSEETVVASISSSPALLARAGLLKGKKFTAGLTDQQMDMLGGFEKENYSDDLVVQDGNLITARGRGFIQFGICLGNALNLKYNENWYYENIIYN
ncbi:DJ-1/PfpI family protein [Bacillus sp. S/N-304-OC-R1]|uniref:DJ-1/PfpI family protein n=1 Tax=Bacillus sp. S/N-304-OC-R1 TaxID=2758034 RepID=UPI001C8DD3AA|nr:DJ-1/PfpI family protein [Bacillus sp. S/N-304-OC-R1]MBY0122008.1 DJ-1/PfpI family protein [Bacillus sp. S/N-304-OC-R1]